MMINWGAGDALYVELRMREMRAAAEAARRALRPEPETPAPLAGPPAADSLAELVSDAPYGPALVAAIAQGKPRAAGMSPRKQIPRR